MDATSIPTKPLVLVVDDDRMERFLISEVLEQKNFQVVTTGSGQEALEIFSERKPKIVLMDVEMPGMNGIEACRAIRRLPWGDRVPILMVTGLSDDNSIEKAYQAGATDFIGKSLNFTILVQRIRYMLRTNQIFRENLALLDAMPDTICRIDHKGVIGEVHLAHNDKAPLFTNEDLNKNISDLLPFHAAEALTEALVKTWETKATQTLELHLERDARQREYEIRFAFIGKKNMLAVVRDVTTFKRNERFNARFTRIMDHASNEIYIIDSETLRFTQVNSRACLNSGYEREEMNCLSPFDLFPVIDGEDFNKLAEPLWARKKQHVTFETEHIRKDGTIYPVEFLLHLSWDEVPPVYVVIVQDITERKKASEKIRRLAFYDPLTDLPNRILFSNGLASAIKIAARTSQQLAILSIDIDRFKTINDTLGHTIGDLLLKTLSERLSLCLQESGMAALLGDYEETNLARLGGDEFVVLMHDVRDESAPSRVAKRLQRVISQPSTLEGHEITVTPSIGIAMYPRDGEDTETLIKHADVAMSRAKQRGKNNFQFFINSMNARALDRLKMEGSLRRALETDELILHYQPQVSTSEKRMIGAEALVRWNHPERGLVSPGEFIPLAEETGLILPLGEWVLRKACEQIVAWQKAGLPEFIVSVNLSGLQFHQPNLSESVIDTLNTLGVPASRLELELTESTLMANLDETLKTLEKLKQMGFRIALDDFGTGYSSLSYLKRFPLDTLKVDRSFIKDVTSNPQDASIVTAIIQMARGMDLNVVAEGVETQEQWAFIREQADCIVQGYLISRPIPPDELAIFCKHPLDKVVNKG